MTDPVVTTGPTDSTPEPVIKAAAIWGSLAAFVAMAVSVLVTVGVLSSEQASAIGDVTTYVSANFIPVGTALAGLFTLVGSLVSAHVTALVARRHVTPVAKAARR